MKTTIRPNMERSDIVLMDDIVYSQPLAYFGRKPRPLKMLLLRPIDWWGQTELPPLPTVLWIVGGAWQQTFPSWRMAEFSYLAYAGYQVAAVDYRTVNEAAFPAQVEDVKAAVRFLRANAKRYGVDAENIGVMGDSAGGYLAAMLGATGESDAFETDEWAGYSSAVKAVADWYGPIDLWRMRSDALKKNPDSGEEDELLLRLFAGCPITRENHARIEAMSPERYLSDKTPPHLILHGTADEMVDVRESERYYDALTRAGVPAELYLLEGAGHCDRAFSQPEVQRIILDFFERYLK
ncbi:MAG: alpha/beta hydrolase [Clostridiales bacterium]|nr:alpha/beta hydrolase [Clostridiales bacterium]